MRIVALILISAVNASRDIKQRKNNKKGENALGSESQKAAPAEKAKVTDLPFVRLVNSHESSANTNVQLVAHLATSVVLTGNS